MNTKRDLDHLPTMATVQARIFNLLGRPPFMTAHDLAEFYQTNTKNLIRQMRRNIGRFPDDFIFEMTSAEIDNLVSQNGAPNRVNRGVLIGFTKEGALQLSSVLTGAVADAVSVTIIRAFAAMEQKALDDVTFILNKLQSEAGRSKPTRVQLLDGIRAGYSFETIARMGNASKPKLALVANECLALGLIAALPEGTPALAPVKTAAQMDMFSHG